MRSLSDRVLDALRSAIRADVRRGADLRLLVAVSGGCDSMVLLHVLHELSVAQGWRLVAAHFNHQLRGRKSDLDEALVLRTSDALGLRCVVGRGDVTAHAARGGVSIEMAARELRHRFLARMARRHRCGWIATAHHADDQSELVLLRLLRGSGSEGLSGMSLLGPSPVDPRVLIVRPLLGIERKDLRAIASRQGIRFREDASNRLMDHLRNRVRHELLPLLRASYQPAVDRVLCRTSELFRVEDEWMSGAVEEWLQRRTPAFERLPLALQRRAVRVQARRLDAKVDFDAVERLVHSPGTLVNVAGNRLLRRQRDGTVVRVPASRARFSPGERVVLLSDRPREVVFGRLTLSLRMSPRRGSVRPTRRPGRELFDAETVGVRLLLRHWRPGDRFQPIGMKTAVKLQDLFTNAKVPAAERRERVVAEAANGELFWVEGMRIGERFKFTANTRRQLEWAWKAC